MPDPQVQVVIKAGQESANWLKITSILSLKFLQFLKLRDIVVHKPTYNSLKYDFGRMCTLAAITPVPPPCKHAFIKIGHVPVAHFRYFRL